MSRLLGGLQDKYANVDRAAVHSSLLISEDEYDEIAEILAETLEDTMVEEEDRVTTISMVRLFEQQIVSA